jgi:hypothetical protein
MCSNVYDCLFYIFRFARFVGREFFNLWIFILFLRPIKSSWKLLLTVPYRNGTYLPDKRDVPTELAQTVNFFNFIQDLLVRI